MSKLPCTTPITPPRATMNQRFGQVASYSSKILLLPFLPFAVLVFDLVVHVIFTETFGELVMALVVHLLFSNKFGQL